jgi:hypothetical protein
VTVAVPGATPVKAAVQVPADSVQLAATVPTVLSEDVKLTVPVGVFAAVVVSVTVAVQVEVLAMLMLAGLHETPVEVLSGTEAATPAVANALASVTPLTGALTNAISGSTAGPAVTRIQSFVPETLWPAQPELTRTSMPVCVVESTLYVTVNSIPVVGATVEPPRLRRPTLAMPLPS